MSLRINPSEPQGQWTQDQWQAIYTQGAHVLVAAAAGAGKTAVLVERIIQRIMDPERPCDVDRLLVVTFTDAAAAQMRERIGRALSKAAEDPKRPTSERARLRRQVALLDRAAIQTLHGFCLWLLRRYFYLLDIDPMFRVLDGEEATLLKVETADRLLEQQYEQADSGATFYALIDAYRDAWGDSGVRSIILELYDYASSLPDPDAWYDRALAMYQIDAAASIDDLPWTPVIVQAIANELLASEALMRRALGLAESHGTPPAVQQHLTEEIGMISELVTAAQSGSWLRLYHLFEPAPKFKTLRFTGFDDDLAKDQIKTARNAAKEVVAKIAKTYFRHTPGIELQLLRESEPHVGELIRLVRAFDRMYTQAKRARAAVDFSDLERLALRILEYEPKDPETSTPSEELQPYFAEVLVDEYQDINPLQDAILRQVSRPHGADDPNLFMVGDVKQSIYRFRLADPTLFLHRMETFRPMDEVTKDVSDPGVVINLKANFRSRASVIDGVNYIFRQILTPGVGELAYDKRAELVAQASFPPVAESAVQLHLVERDPTRVPASDGEDEAHIPDDEDLDGDSLTHRSALETEALVVAELVRQMIDRGDTVYDRSIDALRPTRPRDIAILLRSTKGRANIFVEALRGEGIAAYAELGTGFFWAVEVETILALLRVIDNPRQDIPLAAVLRAPWVDISTTDLARIRVLEPKGELYDAVVKAAAELQDRLGQRLQHFLAQIDTWRTAARLSTLGELLQRIYRDTGYPEYVQGLPGGAQRLVNLNALQERAARFDGFTQGGLVRFLRFVDSLQQQDGDLGEAPVLGEGDDVVRIMSIHKSKGLQFPVVLVANMGKTFNLSDRSGSILYHGELGVAPQWADVNLGLRSKTLAHQAVSEIRRRDAVAEELRVLYVALTRAEERLILVGSVRDGWATVGNWSQGVDVAGWPLPDYMLARGKSFLDWVGPAVMRHANGAPLRSMAEAETGQDLHVADQGVYSDPSRWAITYWGHEAVSALQQPDRRQAGAAAAPDWNQLARGESLGREVDPEVAAQLESHLSRKYPYDVSTMAPAKVSVTLLARELFEEENGIAALPGVTPISQADAGESKTDQVRATRPDVERWSERRVEPFTSRLRQPVFMEEERPPTAAEQGTAMHALLYHIDLKTALSPAAIEQAAKELMERNLLTKGQLQALDLGSVYDFFRSNLGRRIQTAAQEGRLWREWAFTMAYELDRLKGLMGSVDGMAIGGADTIVVQGTIDALWMENSRLYIVDYKTDQVQSADQLLDRYTRQVRLYAEAARQITGINVGGGYLVHLRDKSQDIEVPISIETSEKD